jgi:hypothetical protein
MIIPAVFPIYKREVMNNMYRPWPYFIMRVIMSAFTFLIYPFSITMTIIWFLGIPTLTFSYFIGFWLTMTLIALVGSALGLTVGALFPNPFTALNVNQMIIIIFTFGGGLYVNTGAGANILVRVISWISPLKYGCEMLLRKFLEGKPEIWVDHVLDDLGFTKGYAACVFILLTFYLLYLILGLGAMYRLARP